MPPKSTLCCSVCGVKILKESVHPEARSLSEPRVLYLDAEGKEVWICGKPRCERKEQRRLACR